MGASPIAESVRAPTPVTVALTPIAQKNDQVIGIQYLRAFAALAVTYHHTIELIGLTVHREIPSWMILMGASGVDVFFVISGFIMINSVFGGGRAPMSPLEFISRRAQRIYPLYWLLAFPVVVLIAMHLDTQQHHTVETTIRSVLLLPSETNVIWYSWTLKYEMFFYAAFALCLFSRNQLVTALGTTGLIAAMVLLGPHFGDHALREFLAKPIIFEFTLGLGLGVLYNYRPQVFSQNRLLWALGAIAGAIFIMISPRIGVPMDQLMGPMPPVRFATWGVAAAFIVAWGVGLKPFAGRTGAFFLLVGDASYALYLVHFFVMKGFALALHKVGLVQHTPSLIVGPLVIATCVGLAIALHLYYEKPVARMFARMRKARREAIAAAPPSASHAA